MLYPSVALAFTGFTGPFEGYLTFMYLDTKGLVTTGMGNLIDPFSAASSLPWKTQANQLATPAQIRAEWDQIKARQSSKNLGGQAFEKWATLHLDRVTIDTLIVQKRNAFVATMESLYPSFATAPADVQLALLDMAWNYGPAFLNVKKLSGAWEWPGLRVAVAASDWATAATHVIGTPRNDARARLFRNGAAVVKLGLDKSKLWNTVTPTKPVPPKDTDMATWKNWSEAEKNDLANRVATAVLNKDGLIDNILGGDRATNTKITLRSAIVAIMKKLR